MRTETTSYLSRNRPSFFLWAARQERGLRGGAGGTPWASSPPARVLPRPATGPQFSIMIPRRGPVYFHSPSFIWHTGHLVSLQGCAGEGVPAQPAFLPSPRPPLRQGLRAGATWLLRAEREAGGRGGGRGAAGTQEARRPGAPPTSKPRGSRAAGKSRCGRRGNYPPGKRKTKNFPCY